MIMNPWILVLGVLTFGLGAVTYWHKCGSAATKVQAIGTALLAIEFPLLGFSPTLQLGVWIMLLTFSIGAACFLWFDHQAMWQSNHEELP